ncbi:Ribonucleoside-diphosphate reductase large subunit [Candidatus Fokinia solitaria]|uniref:Ribonucleoside-diphosphate reductase n=1 Tax=Candidatus Fokinia solitaria TaxID=1802984 RepID=A0A2U8BRH9_9RICK|nr:ribonucleoside-diphosphate reductase subunit alpha [Candidatus Fokinia solitaria]AWD32954.1 Ribonucleoside-diphosphate reductase large subunit [Candidatus Fokinia solitaria]
MSDIIFKQRKFHVSIDLRRNERLQEFSRTVMKDRYLIGNETPQDLYSRVASYYASDSEHAQRLYDYMSLGYFSPPTPVLSSGGTTRGYPVSCFLNEVPDSLDGILDTIHENGKLSAAGGGIGTYWGNVRSIGERISGKGRTSGIMPFLKMSDSAVLAVSQGSLRRGSAAAYLQDSHPEIREFIDAKKLVGSGDLHRKFINLYHGVLLTDAFMKAMINGDDWHLRSPATGEIIRTVKAREIWIQLLISRLETGVPYIIFIDNVNKQRPDIYKKLQLEVKLSNLCTEIVLATGEDYNERIRTAVCILSSVNLADYEKWKDNDRFIYDILLFLDNVVEDFIGSAKGSQWHKNAVYAATQERSLSLGVMGWHDFLQQKGIPFNSELAKKYNQEIFSHIKKKADIASTEIAKQRGACPDAQKAGVMKRFVHVTGIAPTASISILNGNTSPCIEPWQANCIAHKTLSGTHYVQNKNLTKLLQEKDQNLPEVWTSIMANNGSVAHLSFLSQEEKEIFKTAFEIDQMCLIEQAAERQQYICQAQSLNLFLPPDVDKTYLHNLHKRAWELGIKSLYYLRSRSLQNVKISHAEQNSSMTQLEMNIGTRKNTTNDECDVCQ